MGHEQEVCLLPILWQEGDTPIGTIVRAATRLSVNLDPYTKEEVESLCILPYAIGGQVVNG